MFREIVSPQRPETKTPAMIRSNKVLVILNWGPFARYRTMSASMTIGELRRQVAKAVGRIFDDEVVGVELVVTDSGIAPELRTPLRELGHGAHRNVCLDVRSSSDSSPSRPANSIGEHLLRKHLRQERFQSGLDSQLWRLIELSWPHAVFALRTKAKGGDCREAALRLKLDRYPFAPPLVELWNAETRSTIAAEQWPEWFISFVSESYPQFADIAPGSYSPNLLRISTVVASRLKRETSQAWDVKQDLTQVLIRASCCLRPSHSRSANTHRTSKGG